MSEWDDPIKPKEKVDFSLAFIEEKEKEKRAHMEKHGLILAESCENCQSSSIETYSEGGTLSPTLEQYYCNKGKEPFSTEPHWCCKDDFKEKF